MLLIAVLLVGSVCAVPPCTFQTFGPFNWSGGVATTLGGAITPDPAVSDPDRYQIWHATNNFCQKFATQPPSWWSNNVPGAGTVTNVITGPWLLTNTVNDYSLSMGVSFKCKRCNAGPVLMDAAVLQPARLELALP